VGRRRSRNNYQHLVFCNPAGPGNRLYAEATDRRQMGWPALKGWTFSASGVETMNEDR
jgi:hypothetical protein